MVNFSLSSPIAAAFSKIDKISLRILFFWPYCVGHFECYKDAIVRAIVYRVLIFF